MRKSDSVFGRPQRRLFCLTPTALKYTEHSNGANTDWESLPLSDFVSIELEDVDLHLVLKNKTITVTAVTASEALNWAQAMKEAAHIPVRLSESALELLREGMGAGGLAASDNEDSASRSAKADLLAMLSDMRSSQKAFATSSVVMAGFLFKMRSHAPRVWQKRCGTAGGGHGPATRQSAFLPRRLRPLFVLATPSLSPSHPDSVSCTRRACCATTSRRGRRAARRRPSAACWSGRPMPSSAATTLPEPPTSSGRPRPTSLGALLSSFPGGATSCKAGATTGARAGKRAKRMKIYF